VFDTTNEQLLTGLLPSLIHVTSNDTSSGGFDFANGFSDKDESEGSSSLGGNEKPS
jgi:hypothetical protein